MYNHKLKSEFVGCEQIKRKLYDEYDTKVFKGRKIKNERR